MRHKLTKLRIVNLFIIFSLLVFTARPAQAATDTLAAGSFIINMGATNPNTVENGLKPYGLIYDLIKNHYVTVKWVISQTKAKDGVDFTFEGTSYKGGTFIIPAGYRNAAVNARITYWQGQGVVGNTTASPLVVDVTENLNAVPTWTLDAQNGSKAEAYLNAAGINTTDFPGAYDWKAPGALDCCSDFFVMPHADPTWNDGGLAHGNLYDWNLTCKGAIWAACHATSALENMINPANPNQQTNFLTKKVAGLTTLGEDYAASNSLILWGDHGGGSIPYVHQYPNDPIAQYLGPTDNGQQNGSEQINIPNQSATGGWNPGAKIISFDPSQEDVTAAIRPDKTNAAASIVYGRGFDDPNRGYVMYEPGHSHAGSGGDYVAAQRVFFNFSLLSGLEKVPTVTTNNIPDNINGGATTAPFNISIVANVPAGPYTYQWVSSCGGTFSNATGTFSTAAGAVAATSTTFTAPAAPTVSFTCPITCVISDACGRQVAESKTPVILSLPVPPVANLNLASTTPGDMVTITPLDNDTDGNLDPLTVTGLGPTGTAASITTANGQFVTGPNNTVLYQPNPGFEGTDSVIYTICDPGPLCDTAWIKVVVGPYFGPCGLGKTQVFLGTGGAVVPSSVTDVSDPSKALGPTDGDGAEFDKTGSATMTLDLGQTYTIGDTIKFKMASKSNGKLVTMKVEGGTTSSITFTGAAVDYNSSSQVFADYEFVIAVANTQFLRFEHTTTAEKAYLESVFIEINDCVADCQAGFAAVIDAKYATLDFSNNNVSNPDDVIGAPDDSFAEFNAASDELIVDLGELRPAGSKLGFFVEIEDNVLASVDVSASITSGGTYSGTATMSYASKVQPTMISYEIPTGGAQFVKITNWVSAGGKKFKIDAIKFVAIDCQNVTPITLEDTVTVCEDNPIVISPTPNDIDPLGGALTLTIINGPQNGLAAVNVDNTITYTPSNDYDGVDSINYKVCNSAGYCAFTTVNIGIVDDGCATANYKPTVTTTPTTNTVFASEDTYLDENNSAKNYGATATLSSRYHSTQSKHILLKITPTIPAGATVTSAKLVMYTNNNKQDSIGVYRMTNDWVEGTKDDGNASGTDPTWDNREEGTPIAWTDGLGAAGDYDANNMYAAVVTPGTSDTKVEWDITTLVKGWNTGLTNKGLLLKRPTNPGSNQDENVFWSSEETETAEFRPRIEYTYTTSTCVTAGCAPIPNRPPVAQNNDTCTTYNNAITINVSNNDADPDDVNLGSSFGLDTNSVTVLTGYLGFPNSGSATASGGSITYTPTTNSIKKDTVFYSIADSLGLKDTAMLVICMNGVPITANNDMSTTVSGTPDTIDVTVNDVDPLNGALTVSLDPNYPPSSGTVTIIGDQIIYTPNPGFTGVDTFQYIVCNSNFPPTCATAIVSMTVTNQAPTPLDDSVTTAACAPITINVLDNDGDPEGNNLTTIAIGAVSPATAGSAVISGNTVIFSPSATFTSGFAVISYTVIDDGIFPLTAFANIVVTHGAGPVNNPPNAVRDTFDIFVNETLYADILTNDSEPDGDALTNPVILTNGTQGTAVMLGNGLMKYIPTGFNYVGYDSVKYAICDTAAPQTGCTPNPKCDTAWMIVELKFVESPAVGVAKEVTNQVNNGNGTHDITYSVKIKNFGNVVLNNVQVSDTLTNTFPSPVTYVMVGTPTSSTLSVNASFDGTASNANLLAASQSIALGDSATVSFTVRVTPTATDTFNNTALVSGTSPNGFYTAGDSSQNGSNTDPDNDLDATNNNIQTPVTLEFATVVANTENGTVGATGGTAIANVASNDSVNSAPAVIGTNAAVSQSTSSPWPTGITLNTSTGAIDVASGTAPGAYPVLYILCDLTTPTPNCDSIVDTVFVTPVIDPDPENGTVTALGGTAIANVASNDSTNGVPSTLGATGNSTVAQSGTWPTGITLNTTTGAIAVAPGTTPGAYPVTYQLCDKLTPVTCATVVDTIFVTPVIDPETENGTVTAAAGGIAITNVASNDSTNGVPSTLGATGNSTVAVSGTWPTGITLAPLTGAISVAPGTTPGAYPVTYQLCDKLTPVTCATVVDTIFVTPVIDPETENGTVTAAAGGTAISNVASNDSTNGVPSTLGATGNSTVAQSGTWPTGVTLNTTTGAIDVAPGTTPGAYPVTYQLCDKLTPTTCATVVDTIFVTPVIDPETENGTVTALGGTAIPDVTSNDSTNGQPTTLGATGNSTVAQSGTWPTGVTLNTTTGAIDVAPGTTPGAYPVTYELCDKLTPTTCATVVDTIFVTPVIDPDPENGTAPATGGIAIANVTTNDSTNGVPTTLGATGNSTISESGATWPTGISLNTTTGAIDVAPGTTPGAYPVTYELCDKLTPVTCATTVDTIFVTPVIDPDPENGTAPATGGIAIANVTTNDSTNGVPTTLGATGNSTISESGATWPTGISLNTTTGAINVAPGTTPGAYPVTYELCDKLTPTTCATTVDTIFVTPVIDPDPENGTAPATGGIAIANVTTNDSTNGVPTTLGATGNSTISESGATWPTGISLNTTTGAIDVAPGTTPGAYPVTYELCDKLTPVTCATTVDTIFVTPVIDPDPENGTAPATGGIAIANVTTNDSTNGVPTTLGATGNSTISESGATWPTGISLNTTTGAIDVASGTTPGAYPVTYQLCDKLTPTTCATVVDTIFVTPVIDPETENGTVTAAAGGTAISNVASNDSTNGQPTTLGATGNSTVAQSGTWPTGVTLNTTTGAIDVAPGTTPGAYPVTYELCDKLTPVTCATVVDTIFVTPVVDPDPEAATVTALGGTAIPNVTANDSTNGAPTTLGASGNSTISQVYTWPTGFSLNTTTGAIDVAPGTTPGVYQVTYELCDKLTPTTCATTVDTITVTPVIDPETENGTVTSALGGTAISNVASNDSVNGVPATIGATGNSTISQSGTWPTGIALNPATGAIDVTAGTTPGAYPVTYELCDKLTPTKCATVVDTIFVTPSIDPDPENGTVTALGGTAIPDVTANDSTNGQPTTLGATGNSTIAQSGTWPTGITLNPTTGSVDVAPGTTPGAYPVTYELCDKLTPVTCATVVDTIFVTPVIDPETENGTVTSALGGTAISNVASNDSVNGAPATLGATGNATVAQSGTWPTGIALNSATGAIDVAAGTTPGAYPVTYELCDKLTPTTCATVVDTIFVTPSIDPDPETGTVTALGGTAIPDVTANDSTNGQPTTLGATGNSTIAQSGTWPTGITLDPNTGSVSVASGTTPGAYPVTYELCDKLTPTTCATVVDTIFVTPVIDPETENGTVTSALGGTAISNVASNDSVNGAPATLGATGNATVAQSGTWPTGIALNPATGAIDVTAGTTPGAYPVTYELCDKLTPTTCATVVDTIFVTPSIDPDPETGTVTALGGTAIPNVTSNDSTNGQPTTLGATGNSTIAQSGVWPIGITLDPNTGSVSVAPGTTPGAYPVTYELCDKLTPTTCATVVDTIFVTPVIDPETENGTVTSALGGTAISNVASNDSVNGAPATLGATGNATVAQSGTWPTGIALNPATGAIDVTAGTTPGAYPVTYELCDKLTPTTCATVVDTIFVTPSIDPDPENGTVTALGGTAIPDVTANDSTNGQPTTLGATGNSTIAQSGVWPTGITLDPNTGSVSVAPGTTPGAYPVTYELCDKLTPTTCATVVDTIFVSPVIDPETENGTVTSALGGTAISNVASNDSVNGAPATLGATGNATVAQSGTWPTGIALNSATGAIDVAAGTTPGAYPVTYELCDKLTPTTCATVVDTIFVTPSIDPDPETGTVTALGGTAIPDVTANDSTNGQPTTLGATGNSTIAQSGTWPTGITLDPNTGSVSVASGTTPGAYPVTYELCDKLTPTTCATVVDTIFVSPVIDPETENGTVTSALGGTAISNVASNDSVNGAPATLGATGNATVAQSGTWPTGIALNPATGAIDVTAGTTPGAYPVTYELCDKLTPTTCATVVDTIFVTPSIDPDPETGTVTALGGTAIPNVTSNDSTNGQPTTLGATGNSTIAQSGTWPTGITLNPTTGSVDVAPGTTPGAYPVTYELCDKLTPVTCATVVDTIFVSPVIDPETENGTVTSALGGTAISNVASNDSVNGAPATLGATGNATVAQSGTWPTGIALNPATGAIDVTTGTPPGAYPVTYELCDKLTPTTCATVVDTIFVTPSVDPDPETGTVTVLGGTAIPDVTANDSTNGQPTTLGATGNSTIAQSGTWPTGITLDPNTGSVSVAPGTTPGAYPVTYELCDKLTPVTCATVVDTIIVSPVIDPETENGTVTSALGGIAISNIASNDSVNGAPATLGATGNATVGQSGTWPIGIYLTPGTGAINVVPGTTPGAYPVTYQLCDKLTPTTCATVVDTIFVTPSIDPDPENGTVTSLSGGTAIADVTSNDSTNGQPTTLGATGNSTIAQSGTWPTGITLDPNTGSVNVAPGTTPGAYPVTYELCDKLTPVTCATVVDTIFVTPVINPVYENGSVSATGGTAIPNVTSNDSTNGQPTTLGATGNSTIAQSGTWPTGITLNPTTGSIDVAPGTTPGTYPVTYQLCDKLTPVNCATVVDTIFISNSIIPITENGTVTSALGGTAVSNVASNDSVNGLPATLGASGNATVAQSSIWPTGITLNPATGAIDVAPGTTPGAYPVTYQLCDKLVPVACATMVDTIFVTPVVDPDPETGTVTASGGTAIPNVTSNDSTNGQPATLGATGNSTIAQSGTWPTGITLDPNTGSVDVAPGTTPGTYPVTYELCDKLTPTTCATVVDTIIVMPSIDPDPETGTVTALGGTAIPNVTSNDSTNGQPTTLGATGNSTVSQSGTWPTGITLDPNTGSVNVAPGTTPGTYPVTYELCDKLTPATCATVVDTIIVSPVIDPTPENSTVTSSLGGTAISNVASNDSVNGAPATLGATGNATVSQSGTWPTGITLDPNTGSVNVAPGTTPGTYPVTYELCDKLTPTTCATVVDTIVVTPSIDPNPETGTVTALGGTAIPNVTSNDSTNGQPTTLGATGNSTIAQSGTWPTGITLDPNTGSVNVAPGTTPGTYPVTYELCDKLTPATCATVVDTIIVTPSIDPDPESGTVTALGGTAIPNVTSNDSTNGQPTTLGATGNSTIAQSGTWPTGITLDPNTGSVNVAPGTTPGTYPVTYELCDKLTPATCATVVDTIIVSPVIDPDPESGTVTSSLGGTAISNVASNDSVNGAPATLGVTGNSTVSQSGTWPTGITLDPNTGSVNVAPGTTPGTYPVTYELCDKLTPTTCATVVDTIIVTPSIDPDPETGTVTALGGTAIPNVTSNDSTNGQPTTLGATGNSTIAQSGTWPTGITLNPATGAIDVAPGTTPGTYPVTYELCDKLTPATCATVVDTIIVSPVIDPDPESGTVTSSLGGTAISNVASNDSVNGAPATLGVTGNSTVSQSGTWPTGITLDPNTGSVDVAPGTTPGTYPVTYELCDKLTPTTCTTVVDTIVVTPSVDPDPETGTVTALGGTAIPNVTSNDSTNGQPTTLGATGNSTIAQSGTWPTGITLDPNTGSVNVAPGTTPGTYPVTYELCDKLTPATCATVVDTIIVSPVIDPTPENSTVTSSLGGTAISNVASNDSVNGAPATLGATGNATVSQSGTWPTGITLDPNTGSVNVAPGTTPGTYPVTYELCDKLTPTTCATVVDTIVVTPSIDPNPETGTVTALGGTAIPNVTSNDSTNGQPTTLGATGNSTIAQSGTWPTGITLDPNTGSVNVAPGTTPGTYPVTYELCDKLTPATCATVVDTIIVSPVIDPTPENSTVTSSLGGTAISNVASNDSVNGAPATLGATGNATVSQSGTWPTGITLDPNTGSVNVAPGTTPGTYPVTYELCDKLTPTTCATVVDTIVVTPSIDPNPETGTVTALGGTAIPNVTSNDSTNGQPTTLGATGNSTVSQSGTWPTGITLDPNTGSVNVAPGTTPGTYPVTYELCDKLTPATCATVVDTIIISPVIDPDPESGTVTALGGTAIPNVTANDSTNGQPTTLGATGNSTVSQSGTWPTGITLNPTTGSIDVAPGTTPGTYPVTYELCDKLTPATCATVVDTIYISNTILPITENGSVTSALGGTAISNVASNDSVNGLPATLGASGNATVAQSGTWPTGITLNTTTGAIDVTPGTTPGAYPVTYQLCDKLTPVACATVVDTIFVTPSIDPNPETGTTTALGGTAIPNVTANDSTNGQPTTLGATGNSTISQSGTWPTGITLDPNTGSVNVAPGTTPGTYPVTYELCDKLTPTTCATIVDTIIVSPSVDPDPENGTVTSVAGGIAIPNVTSNDSTNGVPTTLGATGNSTIAQSGTWPIGISLNTTSGSISVLPGTPAGAYPVTYELCDKLTPVTCATVVDTIYVTPPNLIPDFGVTYVGDTLNGNVNTNDQPTTGTTYGSPIAGPNNPSGCTPVISSTGSYSFTCNTPGTYVFLVPVCEPAPSTICTNVPLTITVTSPTSVEPIATMDHGATPINTPITLNITANDACRNGVGCVLSTPTVVTPPANGSYNPTTGVYTPNTGFTGVDSFQYAVCDNQTVPQCDTAWVIITVNPLGTPNSTTAVDDFKETPFNTPVSGNALLNDTDPELNGQTAVPQTTTIAGKGTLVLQGNGEYTFTPATGFTGSISFPYTTCDNGTPQACATATIHILISTNFALPVDMSYFTLDNENCDVTLNWGTKQEANSSHFNVMRKAKDEPTFEVVGKVMASGTSTSDKDYSYTDSDLEAGTYEYRIQSVDIDNSTSLSDIRLVNLDCNKQTIDVYPNPAADIIFIKVTSSRTTKSHIKMIDMSGRTIFETDMLVDQGSKTVELPIGSVASGLYSVTVSNKYETQSFKVRVVQ